MVSVSFTRGFWQNVPFFSFAILYRVRRAVDALRPFPTDIDLNVGTCAFFQCKGTPLKTPACIHDLRLLALSALLMARPPQQGAPECVFSRRQLTCQGCYGAYYARFAGNLLDIPGYSMSSQSGNRL
jgi:hypothetical protein